MCKWCHNVIFNHLNEPSSPSQKVTFNPFFGEPPVQQKKGHPKKNLVFLKMGYKF
jgi:hypothetical protein